MLEHSQSSVPRVQNMALIYLNSMIDIFTDEGNSRTLLKFCAGLLGASFAIGVSALIHKPQEFNSLTELSKKISKKLMLLVNADDCRDALDFDPLLDVLKQELRNQSLSDKLGAIWWVDHLFQKWSTEVRIQAFFWS